MSGDVTTALPDEDTHLLAAWVGGDAGSGKKLVARHYLRILSFFSSRVGPELARDLTQDTFLVLCSNKVDFRGDASVIGCLFGIARWKLVEHLRKYARRGKFFDPGQDAHEVAHVTRSLISLLQDREREVLVVQAIRSLALDDQIVLELRDYEGLALREQAAMYGVGVDTISTRVNRARHRLRQRVQKLASSPDLAESTLTNLHACMATIRVQLDLSAGASQAL